VPGDAADLLTPVVEMEPSAYETVERPRPAGTIAQNPEGWFELWRASLEDAGISGLEPWTPGSWLVPIERLQEPHVLRAIVTRALSRSDPLDLEEIGALSGGYILHRDGATLMPGCCGDIATLDEWREAATDATDAWTDLWIGHPWTFVRGAADVLTFTEPSERASADGLKEALSVPRAELLRAIDRAAEQRDDFGRRLLPVVQSFRTAIDAQAIVDVLIRGHR
jgi:hypothetical protein